MKNVKGIFKKLLAKRVLVSGTKKSRLTLGISLYMGRVLFDGPCLFICFCTSGQGMGRCLLPLGVYGDHHYPPTTLCD